MADSWYRSSSGAQFWRVCWILLFVLSSREVTVVLVHRRCFIISCDARDMLCMAVPAAVADLMDFAVKTIVEKCLQLRGRAVLG